MIKFFALLRRNYNFKILSSVQVICYFGMWFSHTGVFTLLIELNAPVWAITLCAAMAFLPSVLLAPFSGILVDKFPPKPMFIAIMIIEIVSVLMLLFITLELLWLLFVLVFLRMGVGSIYFQVEMSLLPKILTKSRLKIANEIHSIIWAVSYTIGMGLAGLFIHYFGVNLAFIFDALLYLVGLVLLFKLKLNLPKQNIKIKIFTMLKDGILYLKANPLLVHIILLHAFVGITAYDTLIALMANFAYKEVLSASLVIGFMNMSRAVSLAVAPLILSKITNNKTLVYLYFGQFLGIFIWSFTQFNFYFGLFGLLCAGFCTSTLWSYTYTMLQNLCQKEFYGRVIAYNDMIFLLVSTLTSFAIGYFYELGLSIKMITILMASAFLVGAIYYKIIYNKYLL